MLFLAGLAQAGLNVFFITGLQQRVPNEALGKGMSKVLFAAYGGFPLAVFGAGHLVDSVGPQAIFLVGGVVMSIGFAIGFWSKEFWSL